MTATEHGDTPHCSDLCQKWSEDLAEYEVEFAHSDGTGYSWHDGDCPACAEAKRIAKWCDAQAGRVLSERSTYYDDRGDRAAIYERVAEYARGER